MEYYLKICNNKKEQTSTYDTDQYQKHYTEPKTL